MRILHETEQRTTPLVYRAVSSHLYTRAWRISSSMLHPPSRILELCINTFVLLCYVHEYSRSYSCFYLAHSLYRAFLSWTWTWSILFAGVLCIWLSLALLLMFTLNRLILYTAYAAAWALRLLLRTLLLYWTSNSSSTCNAYISFDVHTHPHSSRIIFGGKRDTAVDRIDLHPIPGTMYTDADVPSGFSGAAGTASVAASYQLARLLCTADATDDSPIGGSILRGHSRQLISILLPIRISGDNYRFKEKTDLFFFCTHVAFHGDRCGHWRAQWFSFKLIIVYFIYIHVIVYRVWVMEKINSWLKSSSASANTHWRLYGPPTPRRNPPRTNWSQHATSLRSAN